MTNKDLWWLGAICLAAVGIAIVAPVVGARFERPAEAPSAQVDPVERFRTLLVLADQTCDLAPFDLAVSPDGTIHYTCNRPGSVGVAKLPKGGK